MAISSITWFWFRTTGNPNNPPGTFNSIDINMPPAWVGAQVSLHGEGVNADSKLTHFSTILPI